MLKVPVLWANHLEEGTRMSGRLKVLVVDDQARARQSLRALLATWPLAEEVREAVNGSEAILLVEKCQPDLVLMDARMPEMDGLEATRMIKSRWPKVKIIMLSMYNDFAQEALAAGADAFVGKGEAPAKLMSTLTAVAQGLAR
jgi:YesN/AraC family two-component response regulator